MDSTGCNIFADRGSHLACWNSHLTPTSTASRSSWCRSITCFSSRRWSLCRLTWCGTIDARARRSYACGIFSVILWCSSFWSWYSSRASCFCAPSLRNPAAFLSRVDGSSSYSSNFRCLYFSGSVRQGVPRSRRAVSSPPSSSFRSPHSFLSSRSHRGRRCGSTALVRSPCDRRYRNRYAHSSSTLYDTRLHGQ